MRKAMLCLNTLNRNMPKKEQIALIKAAGFDGFFTLWQRGENLLEIREFADGANMYFQSVHAPFLRVADMWRGGDVAEAALEELTACLEETARAGVEIMVCHAWIGFYTGEKPTKGGVENYRRLVSRARELGVKVAFENTEGEEFLAALLEAFKDYDNVGFCLDTGHETCYNRDTDMLALYGKRLIATHINDNLGIKSREGIIAPTDDLHLLPFDGVKDWADFAHRMKLCRYGGALTFELKLESHAGRHENDAYRAMPFETYLSEAYERACRVAALINNT